MTDGKVDLLEKGTHLKLWGRPTMNNDLNFGDLLRLGSITSIRLFPVGSNYTFLVDIEDEQGTLARAVYKPIAGEAPLWDFPRGTLFKRECASYLLCEALGWDFVPITIIREGPYGIGSFQVYVENLTEHNYFTLRDDYRAALQKICLFDCLTNNADRKAGHVLLDRQSRVWGIDHGLTFHAEKKLRTVIWDFAGVRIPDQLMDDVKRLFERLGDDQDQIVQVISGLITTDELIGLRQRFCAIMGDPFYPNPDYSRRNIPWPLM